MSASLSIVMHMAAIEVAHRDNAEWAAIVFDLIRDLSEYAGAADYRRFLAELADKLSEVEV